MEGTQTRWDFGVRPCFRLIERQPSPTFWLDAQQQHWRYIRHFRFEARDFLSRPVLSNIRAARWTGDVARPPAATVRMAVDRTREFGALVQGMGYAPDIAAYAVLGGSASGPLSPLAATALYGPLRSSSRETASAFTKAASGASGELHMTSLKIAKLTKRESHSGCTAVVRAPRRLAVWS